MAEFLIVSKVNRLKEYWNVAQQYGTAFEINDFFEPDILDDAKKTEEIIRIYKAMGIPKHSTMHGAFYDVVIFSSDKRIRAISRMRMKQSMKIAHRLGVDGVIFHVNHNSCMVSQEYNSVVINETVDYLKSLLTEYPQIRIFIENMFEREPYILAEISRKLEMYPNYGVCLDWAHANIYGDSLQQWVQELKGYIKHIHVNDNNLIEDSHLSVGSGKIDWEYFAECYKEYLQGCTILVETNEPDNQKESLEYLIKLLGR